MTGSLDTSLFIDSWLLALPLLSVLAILILRYPEFGVALLSVFPVTLGFITLPKSTMIVWVAGLTTVSLLWYVRRNPYDYLNRLITSPLFWYAGLFYSWSILTYLAFGGSAYSLGKTILKRNLMNTVLPLIGLMLIATQKERLKRHLLLVCLVMGVGHVLYVFLMVKNMNRTLLFWRSLTNLLGYSIGSAAAASLVGLIIGLALLDTFSTRWKRWIWLVLLLAPAVIVILFSGTRIALPAALIGLTSSWYWLKRWYYSKGILKTGMVVLALAAIFTPFVPPVSDAIDSVVVRTNAAFSDPAEAMRSRAEVYRVAVDQFANSPVFGVGTGEGGVLTTVINPLEPQSTLTYRLHIHNMFLAVAVEQGLVGLVLFTLLYLTAARYALVGLASKDRTGLNFRLGVITASGLLASLVLGITGSSPMLYWLLGVSYAASYGWGSKPSAHPLRNSMREPVLRSGDEV